MPLQQHRQQLRLNGVQGPPPPQPRNIGPGQERYLQPLPDVDQQDADDDGDDQPLVDGGHAAAVVDIGGGGGEVDGRLSSVCCLPGVCPRSKDVIQATDPGDAVRVICSNDYCTIGRWMHGACFQNWEQHILSYLRSCGRARSWTDKQRLQNVWTKKGYDLAYKACDCICGKGHLRKDLDYVLAPRNQKKQKKNKNFQSPGGKTFSSLPHYPAEGFIHGPLRVHTHSLCSTGSSPPSSEGTPPITPGSAPVRSSSGGRFDFFLDEEQAAAGNIFWRRTDLSTFTQLPRQNQNPYQIKIEDEGPHGNDEIRSFILTHLSAHMVTIVICAVCQIELPVYDKYPLIDGTFFLSPYQYNKTNITVTQDHRAVFLNAVCMHCLGGGTKNGMVLRCLSCKSPWSGATLVMGTVYAYDIFAAVPCCEARLACKSCRQTVLKTGSVFPFFSDYSRSVKCISCGSEDHHFIKPLEITFFQSCSRQLIGRLFSRGTLVHRCREDE